MDWPISTFHINSGQNKQQLLICSKSHGLKTKNPTVRPADASNRGRRREGSMVFSPQDFNKRSLIHSFRAKDETRFLHFSRCLPDEYSKVETVSIVID